MRVLIFFPNARGMSIPPPVIGQFTAVLRAQGHTLDLFDTTGYRIPGFRDETNSREEKLYYLPTKIRPGSEAELVQRRLGEIEQLDVFDELARKLQSFSPDLIAVPVTDSTFLVATTLLGEMRRRFNALPPTIFGGVTAIFAPEILLQYPEVDMACNSEGVRPLSELCRRIERGEDFSSIPGIWLRRNGGIVKNPPATSLSVDELNSLPVPDYSLFEDFRFVRLRPVALEKETDDQGNHWRTLAVHDQWGCPYECGFCYAPGLAGLFAQRGGPPAFRKRSVESVRREIDHLIKQFRMTYVFFSTDTFLARSTKELEELCEMLKEFKVSIGGQTIQLPYWAQTRPETIAPDRDGHRKLRFLLDSGLHWMAFGLEHGNEEYRKKYVRREYPNKLMVDSMQVARDMRISYSVNNIIGFPLETRELVFDTIRLNREIHPEGVKSNFSCSTFAPFFGTPLRQVAIDHQFIPPNLICPSNSARSVLQMLPPYLSQDDIMGLGLTFAMYVRFPESRWPEIERAERLTPEGAEIRRRLAQEYKERYLQESDTRIEQLPEPVGGVLPDRELPLM